MDYRYACIDESGDTGYTSKSSRYFVVTAIFTNDVVKLRRIAKLIHRSKNGNHKNNILHAHQESITTKQRFIRKLNKEEIEIVASVVDKNTPQVDDPYAEALINMMDVCIDKNIREVFLSQRDKRKFYNQKITNIFKFTNIKAILTNPSSEKALQTVDFYSWAIFSHLEYGHSKFFSQICQSVTFIQKAKPSGNN